MRERTPEFEAWVEEAKSVGLLSTAVGLGARLKKTGAEHVGPCCVCGGRDCFSVNPTKQAWNCRRGGQGGHDAISLAMHAGSMTFLQACEYLTGRPNPDGGKSKPLSEEEKARREHVRAMRQAEDEARERAEAKRRAQRMATAAGVWAECKPIYATPAERYLQARGIPIPPHGWPSCLGFHPALEYELDERRPLHPALVARVDDAAGEITAIWRIFLSADGRSKARVSSSSKLGMGAAVGGAVRIGGVGPRIGVAEGVETALACWTIERHRFPVWASLSTSGMKGIELPLEVERVSVYPDSDLPKTRKEDRTTLADDWMPPGMAAARALAEKNAALGIKTVIEEPPCLAGEDYLDVLRRVTAAEAA